MNLEFSSAEPSPDFSADPFADARQALERGDYGTVLRLLEPLVSRHPPATPQGGQLQLLMATACMGQGNSAAALACCHRVRGCADPALRLQARELLEVLEAPSLLRPREWSLTLPVLGEVDPIAGSLRQGSRRRGPAGPPPPPPPPVGPTRAPVGLAALVLMLVLLTLLLAGCVDVRAELQFGPPGRLQLVEQLSPGEGQSPGPWQRQFAGLLLDLGMRPAASSGRQGRLDRLEGRMLPAADTLETLAASTSAAARLAGMSLPPPRWQWRETNWLVGVRQELALEFDLRGAGAVPGVALAVDLRPLRPRAVRRALPEPVQVLRPVRGQPAPQLRWSVRLDELNQLQLRCWRWSPLGLGAVAIGLGLALVLLLASLRRHLGFGWPELPA